MISWRSIPGYEGSYEVSSDGAVRSIARVVMRRKGGSLYVTDKIVSAFKCTRGGYFTVQLHLNGRRKLRTVHSLVAEAFIGPRPNGHDVCHCDGNPENNNVDNLRYDTRAGNVADTRLHGTMPRGDRHGQTKVSSEKRSKIHNLREKGLTQSEIAERCGVSRATISRTLSQGGVA